MNSLKKYLHIGNQILNGPAVQPDTLDPDRRARFFRTADYSKCLCRKIFKPIADQKTDPGDAETQKRHFKKTLPKLSLRTTA